VTAKYAKYTNLKDLDRSRSPSISERFLPRMARISRMENPSFLIRAIREIRGSISSLAALPRCDPHAATPVFWPACQENILDFTVIDTSFSQCLQGFRSRKKPLPGSCADLGWSAKMGQ
jgi:hypothetical protein